MHILEIVSWWILWIHVFNIFNMTNRIQWINVYINTMNTWVHISIWPTDDEWGIYISRTTLTSRGSWLTIRDMYQYLYTYIHVRWWMRRFFPREALQRLCARILLVLMCIRKYVCNTLQRTTTHCNTLHCITDMQGAFADTQSYWIVCCSVLQCVAGVLQWIVYPQMRLAYPWYSAVCCSVLQCVAECCSALQVCCISVMLLGISATNSVYIRNTHAHTHTHTQNTHIHTHTHTHTYAHTHTRTHQHTHTHAYTHTHIYIYIYLCIYGYSVEFLHGYPKISNDITRNVAGMNESTQLDSSYLHTYEFAYMYIYICINIHKFLYIFIYPYTYMYICI